MTTRRTWKRRESDIAVRLGGRRIPVTGLDRAGADVETPTVCVQSKHRANRPSYLRDWLDGIRTTARARGKTGIIVWSTPRERVDEALVVLTLEDFRKLTRDLY